MVTNTKDCRYKCTRCKKHLHFEKNCWCRQKEKANFSEENENTDQIFYSCLNAQQESHDTWYLDNGCSNYMTGSKSCFVSLDENIKSQVILGDGNYQNVEGKGIIAVKTKNGDSNFIHDVLYVPSLAQNLLSVGQLIQRDYMVKFDENKCLIVDKKKIQLITSVKMTSNKVFPLIMPLKSKYALKCKNVDESTLCHMRFGHLNFSSLKILKQKEMVIGLPSINIEKKI